MWQCQCFCDITLVIGIIKMVINLIFQNETVQSRVHKSLKVWSLYADLEESFGTFKVQLVDILY